MAFNLRVHGTARSLPPVTQALASKTGTKTMSEIVKEHCNNCTGKRNHEVLYHSKIDWSEDIDERFSICGSDTYELLKCCGCENVQFRHKSWFSEDCAPNGEPELKVECYPPPTFRKEPAWLYTTKVSDSAFFVTELSESITNLFKEIYIALQNSAPQLAVLGIRALLESVMIDKIGDNGTFEKNLKEFEAGGYISSKQKEVIKPILKAGHAAMHRGFKPQIIEVARIMDVTENIIETIYINENRLAKLVEKIPARKKKPKTC